MTSILPNCWEIQKCGREKNGNRARELGECIAAVENLGHTCWVITGTLCGGQIQGTATEKGRNCIKCEVYKKYNRTIGDLGEKIKEHFPEEEKKYSALLIERMTTK